MTKYTAVKDTVLNFVHTVDGFIFVGTHFRGFDKTLSFEGLKIRGHSISFIIHTENHHFVGTGIRGSNPPRKPRKLVPHKNWAIHSICVFVLPYFLYTFHVLVYGNKLSWIFICELFIYSVIHENDRVVNVKCCKYASHIHFTDKIGLFGIYNLANQYPA